jgi:hypothetical protein
VARFIRYAKLDIIIQKLALEKEKLITHLAWNPYLDISIQHDIALSDDEGILHEIALNEHIDESTMLILINHKNDRVLGSLAYNNKLTKDAQYRILERKACGPIMVLCENPCILPEIQRYVVVSYDEYGPDARLCLAKNPNISDYAQEFLADVQDKIYDSDLHDQALLNLAHNESISERTQLKLLNNYEDLYWIHYSLSENTQLCEAAQNVILDNDKIHEIDYDIHFVYKILRNLAENENITPKVQLKLFNLVHAKNKSLTGVLMGMASNPNLHVSIQLELVKKYKKDHFLMDLLRKNHNLDPSVKAMI